MQKEWNRSRTGSRSREKPGGLPELAGLAKRDCKIKSKGLKGKRLSLALPLAEKKTERKPIDTLALATKADSSFVTKRFRSRSKYIALYSL